MTINKNVVSSHDIHISIPTGGKYVEEDININILANEEAPIDDVIFIDYDGRRVYSYNKINFLQLTELPANPQHNGLTAQGWNWSLSDAKDYVTSYGMLVIGQQYITDDGKTRFYININDSRYLETSLFLTTSVADNTTIDWGDNSTPTTTDSTSRKEYKHTYSQIGHYVISMTVSKGRLDFTGSSDTDGVMGSNINNCNKLYKVELGSGITRIYNYSFAVCSQLFTITMLSGITTGSRAFKDCKNLMALVLSDGTNGTINSYILDGCRVCKIIAYPKHTEISTYVSRGCSQYMATPCAVGDYMFSNNNNLLYVTVPLLRNNTVGTSAFASCSVLTKLNIPATCTAISANAFNGCTSMQEYHFLSTSPPALANTNAFTGIPDDCKIYVPSASLNSYKTESNWSTYASYMIGE